MRPALRTIVNDEAGDTRGKVLRIYGVLLVFNGAAWLWAIVALRHFPVLLGTAFLAYSFGLRHAVDADHIAATYNVTRTHMLEAKRPVAVGLTMFSLGHSTIVFCWDRRRLHGPHWRCSTAWMRSAGNRRSRQHPAFHRCFCLALRR